jgi:hypothetical protein
MMSLEPESRCQHPRQERRVLDLLRRHPLVGLSQ